jgi:hypothetical protein
MIFRVNIRHYNDFNKTILCSTLHYTNWKDKISHQLSKNIQLHIKPNKYLKFIEK